MSEREQEQIDRLLRDVMSVPPPKLSPNFEARLASRLRPRDLTGAVRCVMGLYAVAALIITLWATDNIPGFAEWFVGGLALALVPLSFAWTLRRLERPVRTPR